MCQPTIVDMWDLVAVEDLDDRFTISVLGRELKVEYCVEAERGGDFWVLEAYGSPQHQDVDVRDVVSFTLDKNTKVWARLD